MKSEAQQVDLSAIETFGEITLRFNRSRRPDDPVRLLRSVQQSFRAGEQTRSRSAFMRLQHPTLDITEWAMETMLSADPNLLENDSKNRTELAKEIGRHVLFMAVNRTDDGQLEPLAKRFQGFEAQQFIPFVHAFAKEAAEVAAKGYPDPALWVAFHSAAFYDDYQSMGEKWHVNQKALIKAAKDSLAAPWRRVVKIQTQDHEKNKQIRSALFAQQAGLRSMDQLIMLFDNKIAIAKMEELIYARIIQVKSGSKKIGFSSRFSMYTEAEKAAIINEFDLLQYFEADERDHLKKALHEQDLRKKVFTTLIPHLDPAIKKDDSATLDIRTDPQLLLRVLRRELFTQSIQGAKKMLKAHPGKQAFVEYIATAFREDITNYANTLYLSAATLLERRGVLLEAEVASQIADLFIESCRDIHMQGDMAERHAAKIALYYSPETYHSIRSYVEQNPFITRDDVRQAFLGSPFNSIGYIRKLERTNETVQKADSLSQFSPSARKALAKRGLDAEGINKVVSMAEEFVKIYGSKLSEHKIRSVCVKHGTNKEKLEQLLQQRIRMRTQLITQYQQDISPQRLRSIIDKAGFGKEIEAVERFCKRRQLIHNYFAQYPHPDINEFIIDERAQAAVKDMDWLEQYEKRLAYVKQYGDATLLSNELLQKIVFTHSTEPLDAVRRVVRLYRKYEFDDYIDTKMIEEAFHPNIGKMTQRLLVLRRFLSSNKVVQLDQTSPGERSKHETISSPTSPHREAASDYLREKIASLLENLDDFEKAAVSIVFELDWLASEELERETVFRYFKVQNEQQLEAYVQQHILPKSIS
ncbi:MAG TPA: hypothetical protein VD907_03640 [Verrucomicrobiae bacterium]|nr:hypothetical protein [Verrucomicrobiae bacterium]